MQKQENDFEEIKQEYIEARRAFQGVYGQELMARLLPKGPFSENTEQGITLGQIRYKKLGEEKIKTKWMSKQFQPKKKTIVSQCLWHFIPAGIVPRKRADISYENFVYVYFVHIDQCSIEGNCRVAYNLKITTAWDGTRLIQNVLNGDPEAPFPYKFAYPKKMVAKINQCLARNFLPELWKGPAYAAWHHTEDGVATYMGRWESKVNDSVPSLKPLLESPIGEAAGVLLAFTCFSVMKPFFPTFHRLNKDAPYLKAKKHLPSQIAVNVQSDSPEFAERLVKCCCGIFESEELKSLPIIDGISIQRSRKKSAKLGLNEFEAKLLQPASVLWINRKPSEELTESGKIFDVHIPSFDLPLNDLSMSVVFSIAERFREVTYYQMLSIIEKQDILVSMIKECLSEIENLENKHSVKLFSERFAEAQESLHEDEFPFPRIAIQWVKKLSKSFKLDVKLYCAEHYKSLNRNPDFRRCITEFAQEVNRLLSQCVHRLQQIQDEMIRKYFTLDSIYKRTRKEFRAQYSVLGLKESDIEKSAYLSAAFRAFAMNCLSKQSDRDVNEILCKKIDEALIDTLTNQINRVQARNILEHYMLHLIKTDRYARIRGKKSGKKKIALWYDAQANLFLLPQKTYFHDLRLSTGLEISQTVFETKLERAEVIRTVLRKNSNGEQKRRSFEVVLSAGGKRVPTLKIPLMNLTADFLTQEDVIRAIDKMKADASPLRKPR